MKDKKIILFDGVCNFCNRWVRFVFKRNKRNDIFFLPLQDERSKQVLSNDFNPEILSSVIYYKEGKIYTHSTAALKILGELNRFYKIASIIGLLIPKFIRDRIYNFIARNRYKWFGKTENCPIPTPELKKRFL